MFEFADKGIMYNGGKDNLLVHTTEPDDILVARLVDKERTYVSVVMF